MKTRHWIKNAKKTGWQVSSVCGLTIALKCSKQGCDGSLTVPIENLGPVPGPCNMPHVGQYSTRVFEMYQAIVAELVCRRRSLGLSQEDICAASGLADGHINKLESFARTAQFPTLKLWAETLGLQIAMIPAPMPAATTHALKCQREPRQGPTN